jgi:hypothetical protein
MEQKLITFSGIYLTKDDKKLDILDFKEHLKEEIYRDIDENTAHFYSFKFQNDYLRIQYSDGSTFPRNPSVINIETKQNEPNPRKPNQVEPREHFALIDFTTNLFWISSQKKRNILLNLFKSEFHTNNIVAKDVYDKEQFISALSKLDKLRFGMVPNLFSNNSSLTEAFKDEINQYEAVEGILELKYDDKFVGNSLSEKIRSLFKNEGCLDGITISGRDSRNLGMLFNTNVFSRKIEFKAIIDENEMFNSDDVFKKLIEKIEDEKN